MDDDEASVGVSGRIAGARREPTVQLGERRPGSLALLVVLPRVADVLVDDAVGVEVRSVADPSVPPTVMPGQSRREVRRHRSSLCVDMPLLLPRCSWLSPR